MRKHGAVAKRAAWRRHCAQSLADYAIRLSMSHARAKRKLFIAAPPDDGRRVTSLLRTP